MAKKKPTPKRGKKSPAAVKKSVRVAAKASKNAAVVPAKSALAAVVANASLVQFTANGRALLVARLKKKTVTLFDLETKAETPPLPALPTFTTVALSADSRLIAMGTSSGILAVQSTQTGKIAWKSKATGQAIGQVAFSLDGSLLFAVAPHPEELMIGNDAKAAAPDPKNDRWIRVLNAVSGETNAGFEPVPGSMCCHLALSPDGVFLAHSELRSNSVLVWHLPTRQIGVCLRLPKNRGPIKSLAFGLTVRHLFVAQQTQMTAWNAENGTQVLAVETPGIQSLAVIEHGATIAAVRRADETYALDLLNAESGRPRKTIKLPVKEPGALAASPDGTLLALPTGGDCFVWHSHKLPG